MVTFRFKPYSLNLKEPFGTAHGTRTSTEGMIVAIFDGESIGYGECFIPPYYFENQESMTAFFDKIDDARLGACEGLDAALDYVGSIDHGNTGAKAALDIALHDLFCKRESVSVREKYAAKMKTESGNRAIAERNQTKSSNRANASESQNNDVKTGGSEPGTRSPEPGVSVPSRSTPYSYPTSYTIGIDTVETMVRKAKAAVDFKTLKLKLNGQNDIEVVASIREITDQELFVDANQAWSDVDDAVMIAYELTELGVGLIEQPFPVGEWEKAGELKDNCAVPVIADEDMQSLADIANLANYHDGINIKLMKSGGIREAFRMIEEARKYGLKILLGCMTESSIGISAAAQLAAFVDWCDLDGNLLIKNDTCQGVQTVYGELKLIDRPGIGIIDDLPLLKLFKLDE